MIKRSISKSNTYLSRRIPVDYFLFASLVPIFLRILPSEDTPSKIQNWRDMTAIQTK